MASFTMSAGQTEVTSTLTKAGGSSSNLRKTSHTPTPTKARRKPFRVAFRIFAHCTDFTIMLIFFGITTTVYLSGLRYRQETTSELASLGAWTTVGAQCQLNAQGFSNCSTAESALASTAIWTSIGRSLATISTGVPLAMTTCLTGVSRGYGIVVLLLSSSMKPPSCTPKSRENISMVSVFETALDPSGSTSYLLTTYVDEPSPALEVRIDSQSGATTVVVSKPMKLFISSQGVVSPADMNQLSWRFQTRPLTARYALSYGCKTEMIAAPDALFQGLQSQLSLSIGHTCSHQVANATELICLHLSLIVVFLYLVSGDFITTVVGMRGLWRGEPVVTYGFQSSLERRPLLGYSLLSTRVPMLLFLDYARLYYRTMDDRVLFGLVSLVTSSFTMLPVNVFFKVVQSLPCPERLILTPVRLTMPVAAAVVSLVGMAWTSFGDNRSTYYDSIWTRPVNLGAVFQGTTYPLGAYRCMDDVTVGYMLAIDKYCLVTLLGYFVAFLTPRWKRGRWTADLRFFKQNAFLSKEKIPSYITALQIDRTDCIQLGKKLVVKASSLALLGYAVVKEFHQNRRLQPSSGATGTSVVRVMPRKANDKPVVYVISMYDLMVALLPIKPFCPRVLGTIQEYVYHEAPHGTRLDRSKRYVSTKGTCIG
ncbi:hypothetical protein Ae201684P_006283 [Aphanomyces euteiches]|nr:hypothetical protein Ae201684P_006283 [Aphanomyces euteiches]KAH9155619.1 hypothetical protein AeRB84_002426 [Aphanomyces euteiches]